MQSWGQWQVPPTGPAAGPMPQPPAAPGYPSAGTDPMATMQAYMQYYNQPAPSGYTAEQWAAAQQQNWAQWQQWQQQYQQWQAQYGAKYQESMKQMSSIAGISTLQPPPLPKEDFSTKPPLPPENMNQNIGIPPPTQNNFPFSFKTNVNPPLPPGQPPPPPDNPPPSDNDLTGIKRSANDHLNTSSAKKSKSEDDELTDAEKTFDAQFKQWEEQFNKWKQQNANHPDKAQYKQYEAKWTSWREKLIERREQMRKKREAQKAKAEAEKKKSLPGGDKLLNILSNTENQGLINNLLGIGKTLGLSGKEAPSVPSSQPTSTVTSVNLPVQTTAQPAMPGIPAPMTADVSQQAWAAQQWAQYNMAAMAVPPYTSYPPPVLPPPTQQLGAAPNPLGYNQAMAPPANPLGNFSQPPPGFPSNTNTFSQPPSGGLSGNQNAPFKSDDNSNVPFRNDQSFNNRFGSNDSNNRQNQDGNGQFRSNDSFNRDSGSNRFNQDDRNNFSGDRNNSNFRRDGPQGRDFGPDNRSNDYRSGDSFGSKDRSNDRNFGDNRFSRDDGKSRDQDRFGGSNRDSFNSGFDRGSGPNNRGSMDSEDRFGNNKFNDDRFGSDRFNSGPDRRDNFGNSNNRNQGRNNNNNNNNNNSNNRFDSSDDMPPELKKLMEKRRSAMDVFKPSGSFLAPDKSDTNFGSLSDSFKKITGDSPFLPRNRSNDFGRGSFSDNKGSFSDNSRGPGSFAPNNDSDRDRDRFRDDFRSRGSDFRHRGSDDFNDRSDNTGPRGSNDFGPRGRDFGPRGSDSDFGKDRGFGNFMSRSKTPPKEDSTQVDFHKPPPLMEGRQSMPDNRQSMTDNRQSMPDNRQSMPDNRQSMPDNRQSMMDNRQSMMDNRQSMPDNRQSMPDNRQSMMDNRQPMTEGRQPGIEERPSLTEGRPPVSEEHSLMKEGYSSLISNQLPEEEKQLPVGNENENTSKSVTESIPSLPAMDVPPWMDPQIMQNRPLEKEHTAAETSFSIADRITEPNNSAANDETLKSQTTKLTEPEKKLDVLPFMGENDPKPEDLNMEPPPELPNLGPINRTYETKEQGRAFDSSSNDRPFDKRDTGSGSFGNKEQKSFEAKDSDLRESRENTNFDSKRSDSFGPRGPDSFDFRRPDPFGPKGADPFGPKGADSFGPRGSDTFGPRGSDSFGPRGSNSFGPKGSDSFGPRGSDPFGPKGSDSFGPRGSDPFGPKGSDSFGPRGSDPFGPKGSDSFGPRGSDSFGPRGPDSFGPRGSDPFGSRESDSFGSRGPDPFGPKGADSFGPRGSDSFGPRGSDSFGPRGSDSFGPRGPDSFGPRGPAPFGQRGPDSFEPRGFDSFDSRGPDSFGPRGSDSFGPGGPGMFGPRGPGPFGPRGPDSFGPRGPDSFGSRGPEPFGPRGNDSFGPRGPDSFGPRGPAPFGPRGPDSSNFRGSDSFGPKGPDPFGPRDQSDNQFSPFGPQPMNNQRGNSLLAGPGGLNDDLFNMRNLNEPFLNNRGPDDFGFRQQNAGPPFNVREFADLPFGSHCVDKPAPLRGLNEKAFGPLPGVVEQPKIPSLLSVKFDPPIGLLNEPRNEMLKDNPLDSSNRPFGLNSLPGSGPPMGPERDHPMRSNFPINDFPPRDNPVSLLGPAPGSGPGPFSSSFGPTQGPNDMQSGFNKPSLQMDNSFSRRMGNQPGHRRDGPMHPSFCIEKQFNYNHGDGAPNEVFNDYKPSKVTDYGHIRRPTGQDYITPVQCFDYGHGRLKPIVPDHEIYPRMDFKHWVDNEHNLKEYNDGFLAYKERQNRLRKADKNLRAEPTPVWRHEERRRFSDHYSSRDREDRRDNRGKDSRGDNRDDRRGESREDRRGDSRDDRREDRRLSSWEDRRDSRRDRSGDRGKRDSGHHKDHSGHSKDSKDYKDTKDSKDHRDKKDRQPSWEIEIEKLSEETARKNAGEDRTRDKSNRTQKDSNTDIKKDEDRSKGNVSRQENSTNNFADSTNQESSQDASKFESKSPPRTMELAKTSNLTMVDDLLFPPGRQNRPPKIAIILRGPPGSGKSFVAKLIKDKELEQGGSAPRILSLDDYFLTEKEVESTDDNGKKVVNKEMVYEYEDGMEPSYLTSLVKAFKKNIVDGFFNFIILDSINEKISDYEEMWSFAKSKGFRAYVCEMDMDVQICLKRNIHNRTEDEINRIIDYFEPTPNYHQILDVSSLLQDEAIEQVQMEEVSPISDNKKNTETNEDSQDSQEGQDNSLGVSKWEKMEAEDKLDRLDGLAKRKNDSKPQTMEDFLQVPDCYDREDSTGKKRVRWADLEERKQQEKMRAVGFVVGQTNWNRMMDPTMGSSALTRTKYI